MWWPAIDHKNITSHRAEQKHCEAGKGQINVSRPVTPCHALSRPCHGPVTVMSRPVTQKRDIAEAEAEAEAETNPESEKRESENLYAYHSFASFIANKLGYAIGQFLTLMEISQACFLTVRLTDGNIIVALGPRQEYWVERITFWGDEIKKIL